jgi:hypothetical protein
MINRYPQHLTGSIITLEKKTDLLQMQHIKAGRVVRIYRMLRVYLISISEIFSKLNTHCTGHQQKLNLSEMPSKRSTVS